MKIVMKRLVARTFLLLAFALHPVVGQVDFILDFSNPLGILDQLGILRFDNFFSDLANLFFGKRRLMCGVKMFNIISGGTIFDRAFRDNSVMILPEAGFYVGQESILEYLAFVDAAFSPYVNSGPITRAQDTIVIGYNSDTNECEFHWRSLNAYRMDVVITETGDDNPVEFASTVLLKLFADFSDNYIRRAHVFYPKPFLEFFFQNLETTTSAEFVCNTVLNSEGCKDALGAPPPADCVAQMQALPLVDGDTYVDGNSFGCRLLHASFAATNFKHCAHVSLDPIDLDPNGITTCSVSQELPIGRFFDEGDLQRFADFQQSNGIDPAVGYKVLGSIDEPI